MAVNTRGPFECVEAVLPVMNDEVNAVLNRERARAAALAK